MHARRPPITASEMLSNSRETTHPFFRPPLQWTTKSPSSALTLENRRAATASTVAGNVVRSDFALHSFSMGMCAPKWRAWHFSLVQYEISQMPHTRTLACRVLQKTQDWFIELIKIDRNQSKDSVTGITTHLKSSQTQGQNYAQVYISGVHSSGKKNMVIFKLAMPVGFEAVPFDLWFDHQVHFNSKSNMDFFEFVFDSSLPDSAGCDHRVHSVVAIERLRMRDLLEDPNFIEECAEFLKRVLHSAECLAGVIKKNQTPPSDGPSPAAVACMRRLYLVHELIPFGKNIQFRFKFKVDANVLKDLRAATLSAEEFRLALAMMLHRRLGERSPEIKEEILVRHILPPLPVVEDFVATDEEVYRVDEMSWDSPDEMQEY